ncbi:CCR4-NOT transcription complex subunit 4 [Fasciola hepatica]|uniref:CCR4-NOT transcription complex subunit 4 n=1 Tax=Fasciola hepatica TaxID=6192 RepID=A0A4E0RNH3_FASHE|nr:CCR4-NOT transcription complex subunit 4 [Fasciola hepatica]
MTTEEKDVCPLCVEPMEADDLAFYPCDCRYQEYNSEKPALYEPISEAELRPNRKRKDHLKKTKLNSEMLKLLPELRVVQPNLIFVVGLPAWICKDKEVLKGPEYFGRYGKVFKVEINQNQTFAGPQGQQSFSAYITFCRAEDAMRSIKELDQGMLQGRPLRVSLGTTKYCSQFLRGTKCTKHECMYLHELGDPAASFTKEEMQAGKHTEYMNKLLSEYIPSTASGSGNVPTLESCSHATTSVEDNASNLKDSSQVINRFRGRTDLGCDRPSVSSPMKSTCRSSHTRALTDAEAAPSTPSGDTRRTRPLRSDFAYSDFSVNESSNEPIISSCDRSTKTNVWNRQLSADFVKPNPQKYPSGKPISSSFSHVYTNGLGGTNIEKCNRLPKKTNEVRRIQSSEPGRAVSHRKSIGSEPYPAINGTAACMGSPTESDWYHSSPPGDSANHLNFGEDPVDIDFDPFLESQQGLAELLAAEVNKIGLTEEEPSKGIYDIAGHNGSSGTCTVESRSQILNTATLGSSLSDFHSDHPGRVAFPWMSDFMQCKTDCQSDPSQQNSQSVFPRIYPPPGFEDNARVLQRSAESSMFSSPHTDPLLNYDGSDPSCSLNAPRHTGQSNLTCNNGMASSSTNYSFPHVPCNTGNKIDSSFDAFSQSRLSKSVDSNSHYRSPPSFTGLAENHLPFNSHDRSAQRPDSLASLFTAAFNTATAMLNHRAATSGDKVNPCAPKSPSPSNFDLTTFFNQLCRHSPFFSSLTAAQSASDWNSAFGCNGGMTGGGATGTSLTRPSANSSDPLLDSVNSTALAAAAAAAAASVLLPSVQFPPRSNVLPNEDNNSQINLTNYSLPPGLSKPMPGLLQQELSEVSVDRNTFPGSVSGMVSSSETAGNNTPLTWQLDDPAIVSSQLAPMDNTADFSQSSSVWKNAPTLSPSAELIQQLWRSGAGLSPIFGPHLAPGLGFPSSNQNSGHAAVAQRTTLRDSSLQSASHPQSTE